ncbi:GGDEF domain-containing protein [Thalassomonas actiniarum]|uniref:diguanylate cyclase n=1 Tax=Thalassomonas actiniarum TaxID=485447 RepID=A0AAE9YWV1_9GAMM|nr:sensor domain-containing diguanylate cyclase [Thalassomonas actiniarum]WDE02661.1 sensor domain-containing diguanylate cyclase [Thalassomonas actiniarum]
MGPFFRLQHHSIKITIILGILLALLCSFGGAGWYVISTIEHKLYQEFAIERAELTEKIATAMAEPIYFLSPNNAGLILTLIKRDPSIVSLEVYDKLNEMPFINIDIPQRKSGMLFRNRTDIVYGKINIGELNIVFNNIRQQKEMKNKRELMVKVFGYTFVVNLIIMFPLVHFIIFRPLNRLAQQARNFQGNELDQAFHWRENSEIGLVGRSFEMARTAILGLIAKLRKSNDKLAKAAVTDKLTGLFNRHKADAVLEAEITRARRYGNQFSVILIDIDYFKQVNDKFGHQTGDMVLSLFAKLLLKHIRKNDLAARWGGEEFIVVCPETGLGKCNLIAQKLRKAAEDAEFPIVKKQTASFGVAAFTAPESLAQLISRVDAALYLAKKSGRNQVVQSPFVNGK